ncbi:MAG: hypothetical protein A2857_01185 [Candidatus Levybacteria bacterium RIFCSPHIGHO2_01_FULL_36_15]|nr:MAG: hypothetical protein A2857_01185 [Candidatus Levybacteria bacterium RIFCSPHIGHO2_01_FULL_36_15]
MGYTKDALKGFSWSTGLRIFTRVFAFVKTAILARMFGPLEFGILGISTLVLSLIEIVTETGINVFLVQEKDDIDKFIDTAWIISILRGFIIASLIFMSAPLISAFFNSSRSYSLIVLISIVPIIRGFINPSVVRFQKDLQFNKEFYYRSVIFLIDFAISITLSFYTRNVSSIIWGMIAGAIIEVALSFYIVKPTPLLRFKKDLAKYIVHRGKWITLAGLLNYLFCNVDNMVVGRILGTASLGLYQTAYKISMIPISEISDVVAKVTFPVFVKISGDKDRLQKAFLKSGGVVMVIILFIGLVFTLFSKEIIMIILGDKWLGSLRVFQILTVAGVVRGISGYSASLFLSVKKQEYVTLVLLTSVLVLAFSIIPLVYKFGLTGVGISVVFASLISTPFFIFYTIKVLKN